MRILLIEDNADLGDAIESKLRASGHSVEWVRDGETALQWSRHEEWDALVLDIMLPGKSGFDVIRELRASGTDAPVLVVTARAEIEDKIDMLDLGADDYLVKPFDLRELEARLRALLRRPAGRTTSVAVHGNLTLDVAGRTAHIGGVPVTLGRREFRSAGNPAGPHGQHRGQGKADEPAVRPGRRPAECAGTPGIPVAAQDRRRDRRYRDGARRRLPGAPARTVVGAQ